MSLLADQRHDKDCRAIREQIVWMQERGGTLAGYVLHYAPTQSPTQAEKIYQADRSELTRLMEIAADSYPEEGAPV